MVRFTSLLWADGYAVANGTAQYLGHGIGVVCGFEFQGTPPNNHWTPNRVATKLRETSLTKRRHRVATIGPGPWATRSKVIAPQKI